MAQRFIIEKPAEIFRKLVCALVAPLRVRIETAAHHAHQRPRDVPPLLVCML